MSLSVPFWNWFWHIVGLCAILAICLPSKTLKKISLRMSLHHPIPASRVVDMRLGNAALRNERLEEVISAYSEANFLYKRPRAPKMDEATESSALQFILQSSGRRQQHYTLLPSAGEDQVEVIRRTGRRVVAFTLQSKSLRKMAENEAQADERV